MSDATVETLLRSRLRHLDEKLQRAITSEAELSDIEALERERTVLCALYDRGRKPRPRWLLPFGVASTALLAVGIGLLIRLPPSVALDAKLTEIRVIAAGQQAEFGSGKTLSVTAVQVVGDPEAGSTDDVSSLDIVVPAGSETTFRKTGSTCYSVFSRPEGSGLDVTLGRDSGPRDRKVPPGAELNFCTSNAESAIVAGPVSSIEVSALFRPGKPEIVLSSITSGTLRIAETGRDIKLDGRDRLSFSGLENGWLVLFTGADFRAILSGTVNKAERIGVSPVDRENLAPDLVDIASSSPRFKALFTAVTGLVGLMWGFIRYVGIS